MDEMRSGEKHWRWISLCTGEGRQVGPGEKLWASATSGGVRDPVSAGCTSAGFILEIILIDRLLI